VENWFVNQRCRADCPLLGYRALRKYAGFSDYLAYQPGELQEIFVVWFLFYCALFLLWRERSVRT